MSPVLSSKSAKALFLSAVAVAQIVAADGLRMDLKFGLDDRYPLSTDVPSPVEMTASEYYYHYGKGNVVLEAIKRQHRKAHSDGAVVK
jgi:hypothetical protein